MILRSLRLNGEKKVGGTLSTGEQTAYLADLNTMLESWSLERLMVYRLRTDSLALTSSTGSYTVGLGAAFNIPRPLKIVDPCYIRDSGGYDSPVAVINAENYGRIVSKTLDGSYPRYLFYDASFPYGTIYLYPEPTSDLTLYVSSWVQLVQFGAIGETVSLPPGHQRAIEFNLAVELAGGFISVSPEVAKIAKESKAAIKSVNIPDTTMRLDPMFGGRTEVGINIYTG